MGKVTIVSPEGQSTDVDEGAAGVYTSKGWHVQGDDERASEVGADARSANTSPVEALGQGIARTATLGLSDAIQGAAGGDDARIYLKQLQEGHGTASTAGEIIGSLLPIGPAGELNGIGERIIAHGEGAGLIGRTVAAAKGSAVIGAGQSAGGYLSQVALGDKDLSGEGFVGAMGNGALWAGGLGGALSLTSDALLRAKALFPESEVTTAAAQKVNQEATSQITQAVDDGETMSAEANRKLREMRLQKAQVDLTERGQLADLRVAKAQSALDAQQARTAQTLERSRAARKSRKAFDVPVDGGPPPANALPPDQVSSVFGDVLGAPADAGAPAPSDLMSQLQGTKAGLDGGASLADLSSRAPPAAAPDVGAAAMANASPEAAKLESATQALASSKSALQDWLDKYGGGDVGKFERGQAARDYAEGMRPKEAGVYSKEGLGSKVSKRAGRGVSYEFRGTDAERAAMEDEIFSKVDPDDISRAHSAVDDMQLRRMGRRGLDDVTARAGLAEEPTLAERILGAGDREPAPAQSLDETIQGALRKHAGEHADLAPDIDRAAKIIGNYEAAHADMVDALKAVGGDVPASAVEQAGNYRAATATGAQQSAASSAQAAADVSSKLEPAIAQAGAGDLASGAKALLGKAGKWGEAMEVLKALGVHVPALSAIPVIGPVLGAYLKAKAVMGIIGRKGGSVGRTAETVIAAKAAATRNRVNAAVKGMLDTGSKAVRATTPKAASLAGALSVQLMPAIDGSKRPKKTDDVYAAYDARMDELARAGQPGAIRDAIASRVQTSDPALLDSIVDAKSRGLQFLADKAPKQTVLPALLKGDGPWKPSKVALATWSRYVQAVDDPASVLEDVARGNAVTPEAAETLRTVYPSLYAEAQKTLLQEARTLEATVPYTRRITLSILFHVPADATMAPSHLQFLQADESPSPAMPTGQGPAAPPHPALAASVGLGTQTMTSMDRRAGA